MTNFVLHTGITKSGSQLERHYMTNMRQFPSNFINPVVGNSNAENIARDAFDKVYGNTDVQIGTNNMLWTGMLIFPQSTNNMSSTGKVWAYPYGSNLTKFN